MADETGIESVEMKNIAVILAGGKGTRLGEHIPKQFLKIAGKKVIEHTISVFENHPAIDEICVVVAQDYIRDIESICLENGFRKLRKILNGGSKRYESSLSAISAYASLGECNLIFHDAVRPLVNSRIISDVIRTLKDYVAVDVAVPTTDTILVSSVADTIESIPNRATLRNGQTPQAFRLSVIREAYRRGLADPKFTTTDDCGVVVKYCPDVEVKIVKGEQFNMKLTYKEDLFLLDKLFQLRSVIDDASLTSGQIQELTQKVVVVFGGSRGIGREIVELCQRNGIACESFSRSNGVDVTDSSQVEKVLGDVNAKYGRIDYVINTVGVLDRQPLVQMEESTISRSIATNYLSCINVARASFPYLKKSHGSILFYTSSSYTRGRAMYSLYSSLKAAIVNFVQALSEEWQTYGILVNCINPERTRTPMRLENFGIEPENTLLSPEKVAMASLHTLVMPYNGEVIDVKR